MEPGTAALLALAGLGAGVVNGVAGGGSLVSFPALLAAGYPALTANVTSTVGIWPGYLGGAAGFRHELSGQTERIRSLAPACGAGAVVGAVLLLTTPAGGFRTLAPFLILFACALFAVQPLVTRRVKDEEGRGGSRAIGHQAGVFLASIYGAYFGAGLGVVLLGVLGLTLRDRLVRINGLRSVLSLLVNTVAMVLFVLRAPVAWGPAGLMALTSLVGGFLGARLSRRIPTPVLRAVVVALGVAAAVKLLVG